MSEEGAVTRRALLALAGSVAGLGAATVIGVRWRLPETYPSHPGLDALDPQCAAVLARAAAYFLPAGDGFPAPNVPRLLKVLDVAVGSLAADVRDQIRLGLQAFEVGAVVAGPPWRSFSELGDADAGHYVAAWQNGSAPQRGLAAALRQLTHVAYWQDPRTWPAAHYPGPLHSRAEIAALGPAPRPQS